MRTKLFFFIINLVFVVNSQYHYVSLLKRLQQVTRAIPDNISLPGQAASAICDVVERFVKCPAKCDDTCDGDALPGCLINPCNGKVCKCRNGFVRHNGVCIPPKDCVGKCTGPNEEFRHGKCDKTCKPPQTVCQTAKINCLCKTGYVRDSNNVCVQSKDCKPCTNPNEEWRTKRCDNTCKNPTASKECTHLPAVAKCYCKAPYLRRADGVCVLKTDCAGPCTGQNEEWDNRNLDTLCSPSYRRLTSDALYKLGCYCKADFYRHKDGRCVTLSECEPCSDPNTERLYALQCEDRCTNPDRHMECNRRSYFCTCKSNLFRNWDNDQCVLLRDCYPCDGQNEEFGFEKCDNTCVNPTASQSGVYPCEYRMPRCYCKPNYFRNSVNKCVLITDCP